MALNIFKYLSEREKGEARYSGVLLVFVFGLNEEDITSLVKISHNPYVLISKRKAAGRAASVYMCLDNPLLSDD